MNKPTPLGHDEIVRQVQRLAGRTFLTCLHLEENLKHLLAFMAKMRVGKLKPSDAKGVLDGSRKLTSGQAFKMVLSNLPHHENLAEEIDCALAARNQLIHAFPFSRCAQIKYAEDFKAIEAEIDPLCKQVHEGVRTIQLMLKGLLAIMVRNCPAMNTPEWHRRLENTLAVRIIYETPN